jgi:hypothetical protein
MHRRSSAETRDRTGDLQIFSLTLSQLSYRGFDIVAGGQQFAPLPCAQNIEFFCWAVPPCSPPLAALLARPPRIGAGGFPMV